MKRVVYFSKFTWFGQTDFDALNEKIQELESSGWEVISATPTTGFLGLFLAYSLFIQKQQD